MVFLSGYLAESVTFFSHRTIILPISDIRVDVLKHVECRLVHSDESSVVNLSESEKSQNSNNSWVEAIDTSDSDGQEELAFGWDEERVVGSCLSSLLDEFLESFSVSLDVAFSSLGDFFSLLLGLSLSGGSVLGEVLLTFMISLLLLEVVFWDVSLSSCCGGLFTFVHLNLV